MSNLDELYLEVIIDHNKNPRNNGELDDFTHEATGDNPLCGDQISIKLIMKDDKITDVKFTGSGCAISTASASVLTETIKGKNIDEIQKIFGNFQNLVTGSGKQESLGKLEIFEGVNKYPARVKCATLSWHALMAAIEGKKEASTE